MESSAYRDGARAATVVSVMFDAKDEQFYLKLTMERAIEKVAQAVADQFLADHQQEILKYLDPQAIANLAVADSAAGVREALHKKLPDKIVEVVRTESAVYQKGLFGGLKRIG